MTDKIHHRDTLISARQNREMFNRISRRYDLLNIVLSCGLDHYWRKKAVHMLMPKKGEKILDIGSGTGDIAIEILRQQPQANVAGIDPAEDMLEIAKQKILKRGLQGKIQLGTGDALSLYYPDASYDGIISAFCIRNVEDRGKAFAEMKRVIKNKGKVVILELTRPEIGFLKIGHRFFNRYMVPLIGRIFSKGDAYRYLVDSIEDFPDTNIMIKKMQEAGWKNIRVIPVSMGIVSIFIAQA